MWVQLLSPCLTPCDAMDCSPPGSSVHGILQARTLDWGAISFSRGSSRPRDRTRVSCTRGRVLHHRATREALRRLQMFAETVLVTRCTLWSRPPQSMLAAYTDGSSSDLSLSETGFGKERGAKPAAGVEGCDG